MSDAPDQSNADQLGLFLAPPAKRIWTVRDLVSAARTTVESKYTDIFVEGEVSNFRPATSGHLYFTLKDGDAQLRIVMFRTQARLLRFQPADGMQVIARGRVTIYEARGELQLSAEYLEPKGAGALQVAFEQLKSKLAAEGLFDASRKRPMPAMPQRIGIVTSPRGAAIQDMLNVLRRRHESVHVYIYPAQVQGAAAAQELVEGVRWFNTSSAAKTLASSQGAAKKALSSRPKGVSPERRDLALDSDSVPRSGATAVDVIILARGGGSAEDLQAFNNEGLARAIAASEIPVISAVGHETDFTIADFVADLRAPTPSAAAEIVIESKHQLSERVAGLHVRLGRAVRYRLLVFRKDLGALAQSAAFNRIGDFLNRRTQRLDELAYKLATAQARNLASLRSRLSLAGSRLLAHDLRRVLAALNKERDAIVVRLAAAARLNLARRRARLDQATARLAALSPLAILERGYALVFDAAGNIVKDASQLASGDAISARLARGTVTATVKSNK